jgi:hypothetical protein
MQLVRAIGMHTGVRVEARPCVRSNSMPLGAQGLLLFTPYIALNHCREGCCRCHHSCCQSKSKSSTTEEESIKFGALPSLAAKPP